MDAAGTGQVGRTYTRGRRQPYLVRKWPGSNWALPLGPYTITQLVVFVVSVYLLFSYRDLWAHFGSFNVVVGVGIPVALTYATRQTRIEGRDPLRAGVALAGLLLAPRGGYVAGAPVRPGRTWRLRSGHIPVAPMPEGAAREAPEPPVPPVPPAAPPPAPGGGRGRWVADLVAEAAAGPGPDGAR
jgi:hypothetical protein